MLRRVFIVIVIGVFLCSAVFAAEPVRIGLTLGLSGKYEQTSIMQQRGFLLWQEHVNEKGGLLGRAVELRISDDESQPERAAAIYQRMLENREVDLVFAPYSSGITNAVAPVTEQYGFPLLASGASADSIWEQGHQRVFGVYTPASRYAFGFLELMVIQGLKNIGIFASDDVFSQSVAQGATRWAKTLGLEVVSSETVKKGAKDFSPALARIRDAGADCLLVCGHFNEAVHVREAQEAMGWRPRAFYASVGPVLEAYRESLEAAADGVFSSVQWRHHPKLAFPGSDRFYKDFTEKYGAEPSYQAAAAYAAGQILEAAADQAGSLDRDKLSQAMGSMEMFNILGRYGVDRLGKQIRHMPLTTQWIRGKLELVWPEELATAAPVFE